jgi:hypothetical protein
MRITLSVDGTESMEIGYADLSIIVSCFNDDSSHSGLFAQLYDHPASEVRTAVAIMTSMPIETLSHLAHDSSIEVVRQVANNNRALKSFDASLLQKMIKRDVSVASDIAENLSWVGENAREDIIRTLLQHSDPKVVEIALKFKCKL